ncbi:TIGR03503 family protein [Allopseudospirillum japonicum]|uniref:TIGR03503 family protein n=1 Tax=Allopseudospirillum japonicum TaxID=64971 RepID=A0A1H6QBC9_9GAMM|nr:VWA domain-containing protein [Allopseudospirillum japonicum]SEI41053.1 TIGR03503 family protein [Allopseudospirillum japonicum]
MLSTCLAWTLPVHAATETPDIRVVIDVSGSMKQNDPKNLRVPALKLLIDLLPSESRAGVWTFGTYSNVLVPHGVVNDAWREMAREKAREIDANALYTDIENAIERAAYDIGRDPEGYDRHVIFLSDGMVDISEANTEKARERENQVSRDNLLYSMVPRLQQAGYSVHTVALSENADHDLLRRMAKETGGLYAVAQSADELMKLFVNAMDRSAPAEEVPLEGNRFLVDASISEFTLLVFHGPTRQRVALKAPDGQRYMALDHPENVRWFGSDRYNLVTVQSPQQGEWLLETEAHPDNRVTVISDLKLNVSDVPATLYRGVPLQLQAHFTEDGQVIERDDFLELLDVRAQVIDDESRVLREQAMARSATEKGYFKQTLTLPEQLGSQRVEVHVDGKTFQRTVSRPVNVQDLLNTALQMRDDQYANTGKVLLTANHPELRAPDTQILAEAAGMQVLAELQEIEQWVVQLPTLDRSRDQKISFQVTTLMQGESIQTSLAPIVIPADPNLKVEEQPETTPEPQPQPKPAPEPVVEEEAPPPAFVPPPVATPDPKPEVEPEPAPVEKEDEPDMLWVYLGIGIANVLLFAGAFLGYRHWSKKRGFEDEDLSIDQHEQV